MTPNPEITSQSAEEDGDRNIGKILLLGFCGVALSILTTHFFDAFLVTGEQKYFWLSFLVGGLFLSMQILYALFIKSLVKINGIIFLEAFLPLALYYNRGFLQLPALVWGGSALFFLFAFLSVSEGVRVLGNSLKIQFSAIAKMVLPKATTGLLIFLSMILYANYFIWGNFNDVLGQKLVDGTLAASEPIVKIIVTDLSFKEKVGDFLKKIALSELQKAKSDIVTKSVSNFSFDFEQLPTDTRAKIVEDAAEKLRVSLEKMFGVSIPADENVSQAVYGIMKGYVTQLSTQAKTLFGGIIILLVFSILKGFGALVSWLLALVSLIIFKFLLVLGFAHINLEARSREFINL